MKKLFTSLALGAVSLVGISTAQAGSYEITAVTPTPNEVNMPTWDHNENIVLTFSNNTVFPKDQQASASVIYQIGEDKSSIQATSVTTSGSNATVALKNDDIFNFIATAASKGCEEYNILITGLQVSGDDDPEFTSNVPGVSIDTSFGAPTITITYKTDDSEAGPIDWKDAQWKTAFTAPTEGTYWTLPTLSSSGYSGDDFGFYIETDSSDNLVDNGSLSIYQNQEMQAGAKLSLSPVKMSNNNYAYNVSIYNAYATHYLVYKNDSPVTFTLYPGFIEDEDLTYIQEGEPFDLTSSDNTVYYKPTSSTKIYFVSNKSTDFSSTLKWETNGVDLDWSQPMVNSEGNYVYIPEEEVNVGNTYTLTYSGETDLQLTLNIGEYSEGGDNPSDGIQWENASWNVPFTAPTDGEYWQLPTLISAEGDYSGFYIATNSDYDLVYDGTAFLYPTTEMEIGSQITPTAVLMEDGNYAYNVTDIVNYYQAYALVYNNEERPIEFTIIPGSYGSVDKKYFTAGEEFFIGENETLYYVGPIDPTPAYFVSNSPINQVNNLHFMVDNELNFDIEMEAQINEDDNYVYVIEGIGDNTYKLNFTGAFPIGLTLYLGEFTGGKTPAVAEEITLNKPFTANKEHPLWEYESEQGIDPVCLYSNSPINLVEEGLLKIKVYGSPIDWDPVYTSDGWAYNGVIQEETPYQFNYTGSADVVFTLKSGEATADTMDNPELVYDNETVYLVFSEQIYQAPEKDLDGYFNYQLDGEEQTAVVSGEIVPYDSSNSGLTNNAIKFEISHLIPEEGNRELSLTLYGGTVRNVDYQANASFTKTFQVGSVAVNTLGAAIEEGAVIYNLQGQKVANPAKGGIYIINGKKVLVK